MLISKDFNQIFKEKKQIHIINDEMLQCKYCFIIFKKSFMSGELQKKQVERFYLIDSAQQNRLRKALNFIYKFFYKKIRKC